MERSDGLSKLHARYKQAVEQANQSKDEDAYIRAVSLIEVTSICTIAEVDGIIAAFDDREAAARSAAAHAAAGIVDGKEGAKNGADGENVGSDELPDATLKVLRHPVEFIYNCRHPRRKPSPLLDDFD